MLIKRDRYVS